MSTINIVHLEMGGGGRGRIQIIFVTLNNFIEIKYAMIYVVSMLLHS
jgi:hypothetical protein